MMITPLHSDAFCSSIEIALMNPPDLNNSLARIHSSLNRLPNGNLYASVENGRVSFITIIDGKRKYISKKSTQIYSLARRRYQTTLFDILKLSGSNKDRDIVRRAKLIANLQKFICICEQGNLDIARIVLTGSQYKWFTGNFRQKPIDKEKATFTAGGLPVRSKSERDIVNTYDDFAVPLHYEEQQVIYVKHLVDQLHEDLSSSGFWGKGNNAGIGQLYDFRGSYIHWNVPAELEWMNARGSIWKTYYPPRGTITIHTDIKTMLADSSIFLHEHEGMMDKFIYRFNASERSSILKYTGTVRPENFLETYEQDVDTSEKRQTIIESRVLPRLWF